MEIAKGVQNIDYLKLNLTDYENSDWTAAIGYLEKRLIGRFIEPADRLIQFESNKNHIDKKHVAQGFRGIFSKFLLGTWKQRLPKNN